MADMQRILIHVCCAPCLVHPLAQLREEAEVHGFWYNPNIHPYTEYAMRRDTVFQYAEAENLPLIVWDRYELEDFIRSVVHRESNRCRFCYSLRLDATAIVARHGNFDAFTSTLLYSRHQEHDLIAEIGSEAGRRSGVPFLYRDFRSGWKDGIERSKELGLYRQQYCGCIYSERDRYAPPIQRGSNSTRFERTSTGPEPPTREASPQTDEV
jgi:predicted adenine nucleotide alpha hydrolase (AANH) superfamily ATPase